MDGRDISAFAIETFNSKRSSIGRCIMMKVQEHTNGRCTADVIDTGGPLGGTMTDAVLPSDPGRYAAFADNRPYLISDISGVGGLSNRPSTSPAEGWMMPNKPRAVRIYRIDRVPATPWRYQPGWSVRHAGSVRLSDQHKRHQMRDAGTPKPAIIERSPISQAIRENPAWAPASACSALVCRQISSPPMA